MAIDDLMKLTTGFIKGWKKGKLKETLKETAQIAVDEKVKVAQLEEKIRQQKEEILRLKGEKGKPKIKPASTNKDLNPKKKKSHKKKSKNQDIEADEVIELDPFDGEPPEGVKRLGKREILIQEMRIERRNIKFVIFRYYDKETGELIEGELPEQFKGNQFGPELRSFVLYQYYKCRTPHKKILKMLDDWGIEMSAGTLNSILNDLDDDFKEDLSSARTGALKKKGQVFIDDTGARIKGANGYTYGVSNDYFTQYTTGFEKNRWSAIGALLGGVQSFCIDNEAIKFVAEKNQRAKVTARLYKIKNALFNRNEFEKKLREIYDFNVRKDELDIVRSAAAMGALRNRLNGPPIRFLVSDDGSNFVDIHRNHQLCWVHEIRKYKKIETYHDLQKKKLDKVIEEWIGFYRKAKLFKVHPTKEKREELKKLFKNICSIKTSFTDIDDQLDRTDKNKKKLLLFLRYPQVPLHSNMVETDLRERVIKRKISLQNRSWEGVRAWDLMLSLMSTCRKNQLSFWKYLVDRVSKKHEIPYLGKVIISC